MVCRASCTAPFAPCAEAAAAVGVESASKKVKQQQTAKPSSSARRPLAVVGDAQLASSRPAIVRELYTESAELSAMPESEVQQLLEQRRTVVDGSSLRPVMSFEQTGLPANMLHATRDFVQPSPIQSQVRFQQWVTVDSPLGAYGNSIQA